jgi:hypothetical protein
MTIVYEIAIRADVGRTDAIRRWFETGPAKMWREIRSSARSMPISLHPDIRRTLMWTMDPAPASFAC